MSFSKDFIWGAASAAYQVEGAYNEDGKGMGIWDALSDGHVKHGDNGNVACDHYHRYKEDVALMKEMGLKAYRFSVSWPRIIPEEGVVNPKGIEFYQNLVQELLMRGLSQCVRFSTGICRCGFTRRVAGTVRKSAIISRNIPKLWWRHCQIKCPTG